MRTLTNESLAQFYGTEGYHRISPLWPNVIATDGFLHVCEAGQAFWLHDLISGYLTSFKKKHDFVSIKLTVGTTEQCGVLYISDGNYHDLILPYKIEYTDFPLELLKLYAVYDGEYWIIMLCNEW